ncbi:plant-specific TFIIB-related protein PTF2-like [Neltuma alba]|uniref:plant-specific TFIIB-related protein PTF2-like n=1 Tax=Neltuma alba TaxID=207710 RepID=UPI0010A3786E|nr:plant-specific TFIIB-related protein PTF2-like [Prosopis alba]
MASTRSCKSCRKTSLVRDDVSGDLICSLCGVVQEYDQFEAHIGGINGPQGTFIRVGTSGAEGEFGQGDWFQVLIGACVYIVMRKDNRPMSMAEVAWAAGYFPEFDVVHSLERVLKISPSFARIDRSKVDRMRKQGIFLLQCAMKWFLSTGRKPLPLVVAVLVLVAELNQVEIGISELAKEVHAVVSTCKTRYKELLEKLVEVAQVLPWEEISPLETLSNMHHL